MDFDAVLSQVLSLLQWEGRVSYGALKRRFNLDDAYLEDLKNELIDAKQCAVDEGGKVLVWTGDPRPVPAAAPASPPDTSSDPASALPHTVPAAERRQLTVMFCDLLDSTSLASQLDVEDYRDVIQAYQAACVEVIQHFEGYVAQYLGDGLLIYFGYPQAYEDNAQRAIHTGLGIVEAIGGLNARLAREWGVQLAVRVGIHTGLVVVGEVGGVGRQEQLALGATPNIASRIQALAVPDTVVISETTYYLSQGDFTFQDLGPHTLRGVRTPIRMYRVLQVSEANSHWEETATAGLTSLVGREAELQLLQQRWVQSQQGAGQVVLLSGEAGIGKSRLVEALREQIGPGDYTWMTFRCSPYHTHSAFYAIIEYVQRRLQWHRDDAPRVKLDTLEQMLRDSGCPLQEAVPLFAGLLSIPLSDDRYAPLDLSPQRLKRRTQETFVAWLLQQTNIRPVLAVWEDLHWADPSTLELLGLLLDQMPTARLLAVLSFRSEFQLPWNSRPHLSQITLSRLDRPKVEQMVSHLTQGKTLPAEVSQQVISKTDGIPLFVEELIKMVLESALLREEGDHYSLAGPLPPLAIPTTLQDLLMARLDRLPGAREVAQLGATLGREFSYDLIRAVSPMDELTLQQTLGQLVAAELIYKRRDPPPAHYVFKHVLIQDAAYQSLLRSTRQQYHQRIAQVLVRRFPEIAETQPELLAHHYTEGGLSLEAVPYWERAGQHAVERSANLEAIRHLTKGLEILKTLPDTPECAQHELTLQLTLGAPLLMIKGHAAPEVEQVYTRAQELCQKVGDSPQLFSALAGLWQFYFTQARFRTAHELAEQCFALAQRMQHPVFLQEAHQVLGSALLLLGELRAALVSLNRGIGLYDPRRSLVFSRGIDPGVVCLARAAWALWLLGYPDQALARMDEALTLAQSSSHAYSMGFALRYAVTHHEWRREPQAVQEQSEALMALSSEQGFALRLEQGRCSRGWALAAQGNVEDGLAQLRQGLSILEAMDAVGGQTHNLAMLAEVYGKIGQTEEGLRVLDEAFAAVSRTEERFYEAELYRIKGELLLLPGEIESPVSPAETCFQQALDIARHQHAKSLELRAAMSLCRLWRHQGKRPAARQMLTELYGWFTEGLTSADLQEAQNLLAALA